MEKKEKRRVMTLQEQYEQAIPYRKPMQVTDVIKTGIDGYFPICPRCDKSIEREYSQYCDHCGQKLAWKGGWGSNVRIGGLKCMKNPAENRGKQIKKRQKKPEEKSENKEQYAIEEL